MAHTGSQELTVHISSRHQLKIGHGGSDYTMEAGKLLISSFFCLFFLKAGLVSIYQHTADWFLP